MSLARFQSMLLVPDRSIVESEAFSGEEIRRLIDVIRWRYDSAGLHDICVWLMTESALESTIACTYRPVKVAYAIWSTRHILAVGGHVCWTVVSGPRGILVAGTRGSP